MKKNDTGTQPHTDQASRFRDSAKIVGADESDDALDRVIGKLDLTKKPEKKEPSDEKS